MQSDAKRQFTDAMRSSGLAPPQCGLIADGRIHRCDVVSRDNRGRGDGSYAFFPDGRIPTGWYFDWTDGRGVQNWHHNTRFPFTESDRRYLDRAAERARSEYDGYVVETRKRVRSKARRIWSGAETATAAHPYCVRKQVEPEGLRTRYGCVLVPVFDPKGKLQNLQFINHNGDKRFLKGGRQKDCHYWVAMPKQTESQTIVVCEIGRREKASTKPPGMPCFVSFNTGNLKSVAEWARERHPDHQIIIAADEDPGSNPGLTHAREAARAVHGLIAVPDFGPERTEQDTDFNDMMIALGKKAVRRAIEAAVDPDQLHNLEDEPPNLEARLDELAGLSLLEYERQRKAAAKELGMRVVVLDAAVAERRSQINGDLFPHWEVEPWDEPVDTGELLVTLPVTSGDTSRPWESGR